MSQSVDVPLRLPPAGPVAGQGDGFDDLPELIIQPRKGWIAVNWSELWRGRELLYFLVWRDVKVRYKQAVLGVAWAILVPVLSTLIFTFLFGNMAGMKRYLPESLQSAYPVFVYCGMLPWTLFSTALTLGGMSLVNQQNLLTKIYLPRLFVPAGTVGGAVVDMGISCGMLAVLMAVYGIAPGWTILALPFLLLMTIVTSLGAAFTLSALTVSYRDFRFLIPFMAQTLMWISFVPYPIPEATNAKWGMLLSINPMFGILGAVRAALFQEINCDWRNLFISCCSAFALLIFGLFYFRKTERRFADIA